MEIIRTYEKVKYITLEKFFITIALAPSLGYIQFFETPSRITKIYISATKIIPELGKKRAKDRHLQLAPFNTKK